MERPVFKPTGAPVEELDTPALVVDLDVLERNIETVHSFFRSREAKVRPHVEAHRCPAIARKQLTIDGTVGGISVSTVGEAEVFAQHGFDDIFVASEIVSARKIDRLCALARDTTITVAVDWPDNVRDLSDSAQRHGITLSVVVDIDTNHARGGVEPGQPAADLAKAIAGSPGLHFAGLMTYQGATASDEGPDGSRGGVQRVLDTREMLEQQGLDIDLVSVGGTFNYEVAGAMSGVTEVPAGSYALMDGNHATNRPKLGQAARVMATVMSRPEPGIALADAGQKAIGVDTGLPLVEGISGATLERMSAEHGWLELEGESQNRVDLGSKVWLTPWDAANCVNMYDFINAVRGGRLEAVWSVAARGRYR